VPLAAVQHVRRMRGGAQSHLMRCSDQKYYVVKFKNNPQHLRVLANEMFATRLAESIGLPVPATEVVQVHPWLVEHTPELNIQLQHSITPCVPGLQFGSRYVVDPMIGQVWDYMPMEMLHRVRNPEAFVGILAFDKWTGNADGRQAAFWKTSHEKKYTVTFIDHGYCFNAGSWTFPDFPLRGVYPRNEVYETVHGWDSFEPWLSRIEALSPMTIWDLAMGIPAEWYDERRDELERLVSSLISRQRRVRQLIDDFRSSPRNPFPNWSLCEAVP
jgi:hypothetical protein